MPRRRGDEAVEAGSAVEILDPGVGLDRSETDLVDSGPGSTNSIFGVLAAVVAGVAIAVAVVTTGNSPAPEPPTPSITALPSPEEQAALQRQAEIAELEATYGVQIGDGPDLEWQPIIWNIDTTRFRWLDDGFVGHDGTTEWTIRPSQIGPTIGQRSSLEVDYPGYDLYALDGARLLAPQEANDHVLVLIGDEAPVQFELPASVAPPQTDLVTVGRSYAGAVVDGVLLLATFESIQVDLVALGQRVDRDLSDALWFDHSSDRLRPNIVRSGTPQSLDPIVFADEAMTEAEIADLTRAGIYEANESVLALDLNGGTVEPVPLDVDFITQMPFRIDRGVGFAWSDRDGSGWLSTSTDGEVWSTAPLRLEGELIATDSALYRFPWNQVELARSTDAGRTWQDTRKPLRNSFGQTAVEDVLLVADQAFVSFDTVATEVEIPIADERYQLTLIDGELELAERDTGDVIVRESIMGGLGGPFGTPVSTDLTINDPSTGEELLSVPSGAITQALNEDQQAPVPSLAVARWERSQLDPEWHIEPIDQVFPNAVGLELIPGDGHVLAVVSTPTGTDLYVAATNPGP